MSDRTSPPRSWPLGQRDAHDAATAISEPLTREPSWAKARAVFRRDLAARLVGSTDKGDMLRRLDAFNIEFRARLNTGPS